MPAKAVYLISPGYRRWLTPDFTDIEFELEGFAANDNAPWQAHLFVRDLDSEAESRSITPIEGASKRLLLPAPKFHRRAEATLMIEHRRTKEPVCEGRWKLTNIPKEDLPNLSYFDSRGVFFHEGVGRFPIVAMTSPLAPPDRWEGLSSAGFTGLVVDVASLDDKSAALATKLNLLLFVIPSIKDASLTSAVAKEIRQVAKFPCVAGYFIAVLDDAHPAKSLARLTAIRAADSTRPGLVMLGAAAREEARADFAGFEDVVLLDVSPPKGPPRRVTCVRSGRAHFGWANAETWLHFGLLTPPMYISASRGASGVLFAGDLSTIENHAKASDLKDAAPLVRAIVRGIPEPSDDSTNDHWFWRRQIGGNERAVIEIERTAVPSAKFTVTRD